MIHQLIDLWFRGWRSLVEILLLSAAIYYGYLYFRGTRGAKVLTGLAIVFLTLTLISTLLNLVVIGWIVRSFSVFLLVALVVIFQPELRRGLAALGGHPIFSLTSEKRETVHDLAEAVMQLANKQFGALIAIERDIDSCLRGNRRNDRRRFFCRTTPDHLSSKGRAARWRSDHSQRTRRGRGVHFSSEPA
jgi:DNA integrity scanning protein DisA with diadenylate cyclase activity